MTDLRKWIDAVGPMNEAEKLWTDDEQQLLLALFDMNRGLDEISQKIERSKPAICSRLVRLGRLVYLPKFGGYHKVDPIPWMT